MCHLTNVCNHFFRYIFVAKKVVTNHNYIKLFYSLKIGVPMDDNQLVIEGLNPSCVFKHFADISKIDRGSNREAGIAEHIAELAERLGYRVIKDAANNVVVFVPASPGKEKMPLLVLQSHIDMVALNDKGEDFDTSEVKFVVKNGKLKADGTTLGADNGIGVAAMLSVMTENGLEHGPLALLFTAAEEVGLIGAKALDPEIVPNPKYLLNLDSEEWREITVGCAGGGRIQAVFEDDFGIVVENYDNVKIFEIKISGLHGGHSGVDINNGYGNAIVIMARVLSEVLNNNPEMRLVSLSGGNKMNAIPSVASARIAIINDECKDLPELIEILKTEIFSEFFPTEPGFNLEINDVTPVDDTLDCIFFSEAFQSRMLQLLQLLPNGVIKMDPNDSTLLMSSNNIGIVETVVDKKITLTVTLMYRSSSDSHKKYLKNLFTSTFRCFGVKNVVFGSEYSAWVPVYSSYLLGLTQEVSEDMFGQAMKVTVVHGGLECAALGDLWPGLESISIGPDIRFPHSIDEEVNIETVNGFWTLLKKVLKDFNPA